jgi:hypothetical protein
MEQERKVQRGKRREVLLSQILDTPLVSYIYVHFNFESSFKFGNIITSIYK